VHVVNGDDELVGDAGAWWRLVLHVGRDACHHDGFRGTLQRPSRIHTNRPRSHSRH